MRKLFTNLHGICCSLILIAFLASTSLNAQYCTSSSTDSGFEWITNVTFAGIDNSSGPSGYSDYTNISGTVSPGISYEFSGTIAQEVFIGDNEYIQIWIDWNQDEVFSVDERTQIGTVCNSNNCTLTSMVEVPADATPGETRMRVVQSWNIPSTDPCVSGPTGFDGETEDYTIIVESGVCTPPNFTFTTTNDCAADTYDVSAVLNSYGTATFVTVVRTRSDGASMSNLTFLAPNAPPVGASIPFFENIPFGVTVSASIEVQNPICTTTKNFAELICPAENDEACDATELFCGDVLANQPFLGATESFDDACFGSGTTDVWYKFTSDGSEKYIIAETLADVVIDLWSGDDCDALDQVAGCQDFPESFEVTEAGTYYLRIRPYFSGVEFHSVSLSCVPFDCEEELVDFGTPCDDGDPNTYDDVYQEDCSCEGFVPIPGQICEVPLVISSIPYTTTDNTSNYFDDYSSSDFPPLAPNANVIGSTTGSYIGGDDVVYSYTPTTSESLDLSVTNHGAWAGVYIFTGCPFASTVAGATNSLASVPLEIDGFVAQAGVTYYIVISTWPTPQSTAYTLTINSVPFDCPLLESNIGSACDDGDPNTNIDTVTEDCECVGTPIPVNDVPCSAIALSCGDTLSDQNMIGATMAFDDACFGSGSGDIWYSFTAEEGLAYLVSELAGDMVVSLHQGDDCGNLVQVGSCLDFPESFSITDAGTYYFRIRPYSTATTATVTLGCYDLPANDEACTATLLECGDNLSGQSFIGATQSFDDACFGSGTADVWYTFVADGTQAITIAETESDVVVDLWVGDACGDLTNVSPCNDFNESASVTEAGTYYFRIRPYSSASTFGVSLTCTDIATNDAPCDAIALSNDGSVYVGNNIGATADEGEVIPPAGGCSTDSTWCETTVTNSVWFTFVGPESGRVRIDGCNEGATFDTQFAVYTSSDCDDYSTFSLIGANDDRPFATFGSCDYGLFRSGLDLCVEPGETYYLQIDGYSGATGNFAVSVDEIDGAACSCVPPVVPPGFVYADTQPYCVDGTVGYNLSFYSPDDIGSSEFFVYSYSYIPGDTLSVNVPAGGSHTLADIIPLDVLTFIEITLSDENCAEANTGFPVSGLVTQDEFACDPDCEGVPGGDAGPNSPCEIDGVPGAFDEDCNCIPSPTNDEACTATVLECGVPVIQTTQAATQSLAPITCEGFTAAQAYDVWFSFTADGVSSYEINETATSDLVLEAFSSDGCGDLTSFACADIPESIDFGVLDAGVYYVRAYAYSSFLPSYDVNIQLDCVNNSSGTLNGSVVWNSSCGERDGTVNLYTPNTATLIGTYNITVGTTGAFTVAGLPIGTFDVIVNVDGYLAKGIEDVVIAAGPNSLAVGSILNGDVNNNNVVNLLDFSLLNTSFGTSVGNPSYNALADLNCDGVVNLIDVSILNVSFAQAGAVAPL